jgi:hypothetical protein
VSSFFLHICFPVLTLNPSAGDTAQSISQDSTFRFPVIKALFYEHFAAASASANQAQLSRPTLFSLSKNYRSHQGILALASLVMEMLWNGNAATYSVFYYRLRD